MRVESGKHPGNRLLHQLLVIDGLDVILLDGPEHLGELADLLERDLAARIAERVRGNAKADQDAGDGACTDQSNTA